MRFNQPEINRPRRVRRMLCMCSISNARHIRRSERMRSGGRAGMELSCAKSPQYGALARTARVVASLTYYNASKRAPERARLYSSLTRC
jgi:hypothetical protein